LTTSSPGAEGGFLGSFLIGLFFGFLLGLGVAAGIAIYFFKTPIPFADRPKPQDKRLPRQKAVEPAKSPRRTKAAVRFLPHPPREGGAGHRAPDTRVRKAGGQAGAPKELLPPGGSFPNPSDADNLKARLAFDGMEANVEPANVAGRACGTACASAVHPRRRDQPRPATIDAERIGRFAGQNHDTATN